jgi:predicted Fe-S protein YdhL (DUF1289 family)
MSDDVWKREEIESPCVNLCTVHPETRLCMGCARHIDEIRDWTKMTPDTRRSIMLELPTRSPAPKVRRGGRAARLKR